MKENMSKIHYEINKAISQVFNDTKAVSDPDYLHECLQNALVAAGTKLGFHANRETKVNINHHGRWEKDSMDVTWLQKNPDEMGKARTYMIFELDHRFKGKNLAKLEQYPWPCHRYWIYFGPSQQKTRKRFKNVKFDNTVLMYRSPKILIQEQGVYKAQDNPLSFSDWMNM